MCTGSPALGGRVGARQDVHLIDRAPLSVIELVGTVQPPQGHPLHHRVLVVPNINRELVQ